MPLAGCLSYSVLCQPLIHKDTTAEYELNEINSVDSGLEKNDAVSGIFSLAKGEIAIDGSIHNETEIDSQLSIFDIYIQNGADFLAVKRRP